MLTHVLIPHTDTHVLIPHSYEDSEAENSEVTGLVNSIPSNEQIRVKEGDREKDGQRETDS